MKKLVKKFVEYFNLNHKYQFDITDIIAPIYTTCAIGIILGANMTILFFIGSLVSTITCWTARRLNLVLLNGALFMLNCYNLIKMFL
jgi:hypothetical protein